MNELDKKEERKDKAKRNGKITATIALLIFIAFPIVIATFQYPLGLLGFNYVYSEGTRIGQVLKLSERGLIWKTHEGSLGVTQSGAYVEKWDFSVDEEDSERNDIVSLLSEASKTGNLVEIKYSQRIGVRPWRAKTSYLVEEVNILR